ncbi:MAG: MBL fold metallo-hydrolase [Spirochaetes bacterium]|nr:MBL fold metallo-hydrolase [Spirochaetota bacterium]MBN2770130.1 MBL fold metallo-hydrolase [Spirochaetota bacterium]
MITFDISNKSCFAGNFIKSFVNLSKFSIAERKFPVLLGSLPVALMLFSCSQQNTDAPPAHPLDDFFSQQVNSGSILYSRLSENSSSLLIRTSENIILIDPGFLIPADIDLIVKHGCDILIYSHDHGDHFQIDTASAIFEKTAPTVIVEPAMMPALKDTIDHNKLISAEAGKNIQIGGITIVPVTGYHVGPITIFRIETDSLSLFFGADSGHVALNGLTADIAFVPTGGASPTCSPEEAAKFVEELNPSAVVPMHGRPDQEQALKDLVAKDDPSRSVIISKMYDIHSVGK